MIPPKLSVMLTNKLILNESSKEPIGSWNVNIPKVFLSNETSDEFPFQVSRTIKTKNFILNNFKLTSAYSRIHKLKLNHLDHSNSYK